MQHLTPLSSGFSETLIALRCYIGRILGMFSSNIAGIGAGLRGRSGQVLGSPGHRGKGDGLGFEPEA